MCACAHACACAHIGVYEREWGGEESVCFYVLYYVCVYVFLVLTRRKASMFSELVCTCTFILRNRYLCIWLLLADAQ